jgi:hypothetical protein
LFNCFSIFLFCFNWFSDIVLSSSNYILIFFAFSNSLFNSFLSSFVLINNSFASSKSFSASFFCFIDLSILNLYSEYNILNASLKFFLTSPIVNPFTLIYSFFIIYFCSSSLYKIKSLKLSLTSYNSFSLYWIAFKFSFSFFNFFLSISILSFNLRIILLSVSILSFNLLIKNVSFSKFWVCGTLTGPPTNLIFSLI